MQSRVDGAGHTVVEVAAPDIASRIQPGQFVSLPAPPGIGPPARWMFSPLGVRRPHGAEPALRLVAQRSANGALSRLKPGDPLDAIGPLGSPVALAQDVSSVVVLGLGHGAATAVFLTETLRARGIACTPRLFTTGPAAPTTDTPWRLGDGTTEPLAQHRIHDAGDWPGLVRRTLDDAGADHAVVTGPLALLHAAADVCRQAAVGCTVLLEPFMACGIGLCLTCAVPLAATDTTGPRHVGGCTDGPAFPAEAVDWERLLAGSGVRT
ncbi:iron-sulfur cluster-binding protein [Streptomyces sp. 2323.1]|uniref:iron-sulfur cluster-binding protein n=1 Tax=Streptomyces sp. 2323.1 TaxID=1938841 RepID=UPI001331B803|nr:hypothetical protein [Streptomyces sp. 2323.1]